MPTVRFADDQQLELCPLDPAAEAWLQAVWPIVGPAAARLESRAGTDGAPLRLELASAPEGVPPADELASIEQGARLRLPSSAHAHPAQSADRVALASAFPERSSRCPSPWQQLAIDLLEAALCTVWGRPAARGLAAWWLWQHQPELAPLTEPALLSVLQLHLGFAGMGRGRALWWAWRARGGAAGMLLDDALADGGRIAPSLEELRSFVGWLLRPAGAAALLDAGLLLPALPLQKNALPFQESLQVGAVLRLPLAASRRPTSMWALQSDDEEAGLSANLGGPLSPRCCAGERARAVWLWSPAGGATRLRAVTPALLGRWLLVGGRMGTAPLGARGTTVRFHADGRLEMEFADGFAGPTVGPIWEAAQERGLSGSASGRWYLRRESPGRIRIRLTDLDPDKVAVHARDFAPGQIWPAQMFEGAVEMVRGSLTRTAFKVKRTGDELRLLGTMDPGAEDFLEFVLRAT